MRLAIGDIGVAAQKPQKRVDDGFPMQLFGGDERKALAQGKPHLMSKKRAGSGPGAVGLNLAIAQDLGEKIEIGLDARTFSRLWGLMFGVAESGLRMPYSRTSTVPGLRRFGQFASALSRRTRPAR